MRKWMTVGALAFAVVAADATLARAQDDFVDENGDGVDDGAARAHRFGRRGIRSQLTEAQREEVKAAVETLRAAEASRSDIDAAVGSLLEGYGVDMPARRDKLSSVLSEDQLADLRAEIDGLKESGASREDVRAAFEAKLGEFGVDPSTVKRPPPGRRGGHNKPRGRRGGRRGPAPAPAADAAANDAS